MTTTVGTPPGVTASGYRVTPPPIPTTGLLAWFDANRAGDFTYSNGNDPGNPPNTYVSQWNDRSGNGRHAVGNSNAGYHPKRNVTINALPAVDFSSGYVAVAKGLRVSGWTVDQTKPVTFFGVMRVMPTTPQYTYPLFGTPNVGLCLRFGSTTDRLEFLIPAVGTWGLTAPVALTGTGHTIVATYSATGAYEIRVDGVSLSSGTRDATMGTGGVIGLGAEDMNNANSSAGHIGEAGGYSRVISGAEITQVETYLRTKWGTP